MPQQNLNQNEINYARMMAKVYNWLREYQRSPNGVRDWMIFDVAPRGGNYLFAGHGKIESPNTEFSIAIVFAQQAYRDLRICFQIDKEYSFFKQIIFCIDWGKSGKPKENRCHPDEKIAGLGRKFGFKCNKQDGQQCKEHMLVKKFYKASDEEVKKVLFSFLDAKAEVFKLFQTAGCGMNKKDAEKNIQGRIDNMKKKNLIAVDQNGILSVPDSANYVTNLEGDMETDGDGAAEETDENKGDEMSEEIRNLLESSHQVILTGAPGTGKTYLAKKVAMAMLGKDYTQESWAEAFKAGRVGFCQFHPSYDYSDFVEGLRPVTVGSDESAQVGFKRMDGVFKKFCKQAASDKDNKYVFVVDEINRGDISKIFGELFFSIDPGYRGTPGRVNTQYQNLVAKTEKYTICDKEGNNLEKERDDVFFEGFYVPENVYIIGTMNDIDRSVESMDFAIRRRFVWQEVEPNSDALDAKISGEDEADYIIAKKEDREEAKKRMENLNKKICECDLLGPAYAIGQAYFLKLDAVCGFDNLWKMNLEPLLREYLRGNPKSEIDKCISDFKKSYE